MSDEMKWSCPACGMYVGAGHDCYRPLPLNEPMVLQSVADAWKQRAEAAEAQAARYRAVIKRWSTALDRLMPALMVASLHGEQGTDEDRAWFAKLKADTELALTPPEGA